ncbi:hypothetical protein FZC79_15200 [Rossellomorea vietnamensis]|uniref:Ribosomal protein L7/L12 C-terminal domain-containing protein n=1 Tax=Rossellomorea vietnamensis TaxID=218284 RepID=A0A5D4KDC6_9BACI|nr:hypothetical protein [Rossellomorea vietnamensis]TYR74163.1 hypothetical protein FZC79_15200 [Rossellomorea vietnamensis]
MEYNFMDFLIVSILIYVLITVIRLEGRIKGIRYALDQISKKAGVPEKPINNELRELIRKDQEVQAVKEVRETLGLSLVEAKQYIEALKAAEK